MMRLFHSITFLLLLLLPMSSEAFMATNTVRRVPTPSMSQLSLMTTSEAETLMKTANDCVEGECSLDNVEELISVLQQQQKELNTRLQEVKLTITKLETMNRHDERKVDEVRETVRALFRLFQFGAKSSGNDYPSLSKPTGWSGDVGDGPKSAYDALPPKKWTAPKQ